MSSPTRRPSKHLDPKAPFVVDTHDLGRSPGTMREITRHVEVPRPIGNYVIAIPEGAPMDLAMRLTAVVEGVLISGQASAIAAGECVRCLEPVTIPLDLQFQELFTYEPDLKGRKREIDLDDEDPLPQLIDEMANIEPAVIDAAVLNLPYKPLCGPDCPGLCAECGEPLAADPTHHHEPADSRWAGLSGLVFEDSASVGDTKHLSDDGSSLLEQEES
jgi:uncharacterized protein